MLSFKPAFSLSSFTLIKRLFSSSSVFAIRVVSSAYLRLLIFLQEILILDCASSSQAFHMKYSAYKLNKQDDNGMKLPLGILRSLIINKININGWIEVCFTISCLPNPFSLSFCPTIGFFLELSSVFFFFFNYCSLFILLTF